MTHLQHQGHYRGATAVRHNNPFAALQVVVVGTLDHHNAHKAMAPEYYWQQHTVAPCRGCVPVQHSQSQQLGLLVPPWLLKGPEPAPTSGGHTSSHQSRSPRCSPHVAALPRREKYKPAGGRIEKAHTEPEEEHHTRAHSSLHVSSLLLLHRRNMATATAPSQLSCLENGNAPRR